ncbi:bifunctional phosphopantothenoylcysteine decarboxylase/phosphopantothenate--cysteine ligase CoaBC [Flavisolibacter ginsenosidimutans]|uniref:Coenzyme A biosynthesis bifunctional protein CoaBC n=1 Tax=Flavisolibacter ginsenosidimutans TaxID=661481 RepID=A0A5B8UPA1_9BACT|nr:bifunctional phosphopantothenoylcysteine decarboxylase/phosphopantothenate--cysteine ligase CoaBC [Flavisolibacter ginsenosidimutans]QEC58182.1 bifunctional phosphopantothenoylcysteine decarboxylase/phosphopantothenate--cysteine ligase CoaBC [Flavisolibacter ginsenosidimutans]
MKGKKIVLGITGSIAAYKLPLLVRLFVKAGADVKVVMTPAATDFVSKLVLATLSKNEVQVDLFKEDTWANHVQLGRWADAMLIAPLSCNTLSKMACGTCDNLLLASYLSATCPVIVAPAMDEDMWHHPATKANLKTIEAAGCTIIPVGFGELASGLIGDGRMAEPEDIFNFLQTFFAKQNSLKGKKALVTAGPTYEAIDPVRFIGNHSSGKMGIAIAEELQRRGAEVTLVYGPVSASVKNNGIHCISVTSAEEMYQACSAVNYDIAVMAAAVADYTPVKVSDKKIKKSDGVLNLTLKRTKDILASLGSTKRNEQTLVGFALETDNEKESALRKLKEKNADLIVLNSLRDEGAGFGHDTNKATFYFRDGCQKSLSLKSKAALATDLVDTITEMIK